jgi:hypothetical protein
MSVLLLADAKAYLNITSSTTDAELQVFIDDAEAVIGARCGALAAASRTSRVAGDGDLSLLLPTCPVVSLTSITPSEGAAVVLGDLHLNGDSGVITRNDGTGFASRYYDVTYMAGRASVPPDLLLAVKELVRHLWDPQRGAGVRPGSRPDVPSPSYMLPYRVLELIAAYELPGFA